MTSPIYGSKKSMPPLNPPSRKLPEMIVDPVSPKVKRPEMIVDPLVPNTANLFPAPSAYTPIKNTLQVNKVYKTYK